MKLTCLLVLLLGPAGAGATELPGSSEPGDRLVAEPASSVSPGPARPACPCPVVRTDKTGLVFVEGSTSAALELNWGGPAGSTRQYAVQLRPAAGIYVIDWLYLRLGFGFEWDSQGPGSTFSAGAVPSVGVFIPITSRLGFAPWVGVNLSYTYEKEIGSHINGITVAVETSLSLVVSLVEHFSVSFGPDISQAFLTSRAIEQGNKAGKVAITCGVIGSW